MVCLINVARCIVYINLCTSPNYEDLSSGLKGPLVCRFVQLNKLLTLATTVSVMFAADKNKGVRHRNCPSIAFGVSLIYLYFPQHICRVKCTFH